MFSLPQLRAAHGPLLVIDAASARVFAGWLPAPGAAHWTAAEGGAGAEAFRGVKRALSAGGATLAQAGAFVFCEGPGSILGIRTVAMALRVWQLEHGGPAPVYAYRSLELAAAELVRGGRRGFRVIADARRESWHCVETDAAGAIGPLRRLPAAELPRDGVPVYLPEGFRTWSAPPPGAQTCAYAPPEFFAQESSPPLFRLMSEPDAFLHEDPAYRAWTPQIHRAAGAAVS